MKTEKYPIGWVDGKCLTTTGNKTVDKAMNKVYLGICGYAKKPFRITKSWIIISVVQDLYIANEQCEEGRRCLNFQCKYNNSTLKSIERIMGAKILKKDVDFLEQAIIEKRSWFGEADPSVDWGKYVGPLGTGHVTTPRRKSQ